MKITKYSVIFVLLLALIFGTAIASAAEKTSYEERMSELLNSHALMARSSAIASREDDSELLRTAQEIYSINTLLQCLDKGDGDIASVRQSLMECYSALIYIPEASAAYTDTLVSTFDVFLANGDLLSFGIGIQSFNAKVLSK